MDFLSLKKKEAAVYWKTLPIKEQRRLRSIALNVSNRFCFDPEEEYNAILDYLIAKVLIFTYDKEKIKAFRNFKVKAERFPTQPNYRRHGTNWGITDGEERWAFEISCGVPNICAFDKKKNVLVYLAKSSKDVIYMKVNQPF